MKARSWQWWHGKYIATPRGLFMCCVCFHPDHCTDKCPLSYAHPHFILEKVPGSHLYLYPAWVASRTI